MVNRATLADKLSTVPGLSTPIGIGQAVLAFGRTVVVEPIKALSKEAHLGLLNLQKDRLTKKHERAPSDVTEERLIILNAKIDRKKAERHFVKNEKENIKAIGKGLLRAIPLIGNADAIVTCVKSEEPARKATLADKASLFPVFQQAIGLGTICSNFLKCFVSDPAKYFARKWQIHKLKNEIKTTEKNLKILEQTEAVKKFGSQEIQEKRQKIEALEKEGKFLEHFEYIGVGILRTIPVVASIYEGIVCVRSHRAEAKKAAETAAQRAREQEEARELLTGLANICFEIANDFATQDPPVQQQRIVERKASTKASTVSRKNKRQANKLAKEAKKRSEPSFSKKQHRSAKPTVSGYKNSHR